MKGLSRLIITLAAYLLTTTDAFAAVNMKNASFISEWTDYRVNHWDLIRTYDSRSTHNGLFGYGWCSGLDVRLKINAIAGDPTEVSIVDCSKAGPAQFKLTPRGRLASAGAREFTSPLLPGERLELIQSQFIHYVAGQERARFDEEGRLILLSQEKVRISYDQRGVPASLKTENGVILVDVDPITRHIRRLTTAARTELRYEYAAENLVAVRNAWNNSYRYRYDDVHNLTRIQYPDASTEIITYDQDRDLVTSLISRDACRSTFTYKHLNGREHFVSRSNTVCDGQTVHHAKYEFWHSRRGDGSTYLARARIEDKATVKDIRFDPVSGQSLSPAF
jgi:YD repeat-containing protein